MRAILAISLISAACGAASRPVEMTPVAVGPRRAADTGGHAPTRVLQLDRAVIAPEPTADPAPATGSPEVAADAASVRRELDRRARDLAGCAWREPPAGPIDLVFGVAGSGVIGDVYVNGAGGDGFKACVHDAIERLRFAADPAGVITEVHAPLVFTSKPPA